MASRLPALIIAALGFTLYASTSYPFPDWLDSPELICAAFRLGVFHPPGSPLAVILGHLFSLWPFASPATSLLYFSAFFAGCALYVLARTMQVLWRSLGPRNVLLETIVVSGLSAAFALSFGLWSQAVRTEVYTLGLFLFLCALRELLHIVSENDEKNPRRVLRAAAFCGMGLCVHPLMALCVAPSIVLLAVLKSTRGLFLAPRRLVRASVAFLLGAAPLLFLPLLVRTSVDLRFGDPTTVSGFFETVLGLTFSHSFSSPQTAVGFKTFTVIILGLGAGLSILAALGLYPFIRRKPIAALVLILTAAASALTLALQRSVRLDNPDVFGYALPALAAVFLLGTGGLAVSARLLFNLRPGLSWIAAGAALLAMLATVLPLEWKQMNRSGCTAGRHLAVGALTHLPEDTVAIVGDFNLAFMFEYLIQVEGLRPDVSILYLRDLDNPLLRAGGLDRVFLDRLSATRPVALDIGPHLEDPLLSGLRPYGLLWLASPTEPIEQNQPRSFVPPVCRNDSADPRTADVVAWHNYWQAAAALTLGRRDLSATRLDAARCASPRDHNIEEMARRLDLPEKKCARSLPPPGDGPPDRRPPVIPAALLLLGLLAWGLGLLGRNRRAWLYPTVSLVGLFCMVLVLWLR